MTDIRIKINDEDELFNPFNPEDEFSDEVKGFITVDLLLADYFNTIIEVALSTFGAFCLEEVAYIWIVDYPRLRLLKTILRVLAKTETVRYEQPQD